MGMHEAQALLPMPAALQWLVKAVVTVSVGLLVAWALPIALFYRRPDLPLELVFGPLLCAALVVIAFGMFISSISPSGVRGIVYALPAGIVGIWYVQWSARLAIALWPHDGRHFQSNLETVATLGIAAALFWLAYRNYRTKERTPAGLVGQIAGLALFVFVWMAACAAV